MRRPFDIMLRELSIKDFALIKELTIEFGEGLNILTGATGAGKSILVGAIGLLLGGRGGSHMIRQGASSTMIEGVFDISSGKALKSKFEEMGLMLDQGLLILKRQLFQKGDSRAYANGSRLPISQLKDVGDLLVDLHGQHEHQSLLHPAKHMDLLDGYGGLGPLREKTSSAFQELVALRQEHQDLSETIQRRRERRELLEFQLQELNRIEPREGEDEELEAEKRVLENMEQLFEGVNTSYQSLLEEDNSIIARLSAIGHTLRSLAKTDPVFEKRAEDCAALIYQLEDLSSGLRQYAQKLRPDPERLAQIGDRLQELQRLKRKHGNSLSAILQRRDQLVAELGSVTTGDQRFAQIGQALVELEGEFSKICAQLSQAREEMAGKLQKSVEKELNRLGMPKTRFSILIEQNRDERGWAEVSGQRLRADASGMDRVEFLLSPNPGEGLRPLAKIASGGEISRIMLAMKTILAHADQVPLLIFDEIDVGIGGEVADIVGRALKNLAQSHQVLCITHLHQIASLADKHFSVRKEQHGGRTETLIDSLSPEEREREIARMIGGQKVSAITLEHAREIIRKGIDSEASP